jgi:predicted nuclease of predicted toxin-antitoxin system
MKIKLDENLPARLAFLLESMGHQVDTVADEELTGKPDTAVWTATQKEGRFLITQDLDFSDTRQFQPGTHPGLLLVRLREPGANALLQHVGRAFQDNPPESWAGCFIVLTEHKLRVKRP